MILNRGAENGLYAYGKLQCDIHILVYYICTLSLYKSTLFRTDDVDELYIHHEVVLSFSRLKELANKYIVCV